MSRKAGVNSADTRKRLLDSATEEFLENGFQKASLKDICSKADVTTGALYFFFGSKEGIFNDVVSPTLDEFVKLVDQQFTYEVAHMDASEEEFAKMDEEAASALSDLYFENKDTFQIIMENRDMNIVRTYLERILDNLDGYTINFARNTRPELLASDTFTPPIVRLLSQTEVDLFGRVFAQSVEKDQTKKMLIKAVQFLRSGLSSWLSESISGRMVQAEG